MYPISIQSFPSIPFVRSKLSFVTGYKVIDIVEPLIKGCVTGKYFSLIPEAFFISVGAFLFGPFTTRIIQFVYFSPDEAIHYSSSSFLHDSCKFCLFIIYL